MTQSLLYDWGFSGLQAAPVTEAPLIWSPNDRQERARLFHSAVLVFNDDMARAKTKHPRLTAEEYDAQLKAWRIFRDDWAKWYSGTGPMSWLFGSVDSLLEGYEKQLAGWRQWYLDNIGTPSGQGKAIIQDSPFIPTQVNVKTPDLKPPTDPWTWWVIGGGLALIAGGTYLVVRRKGGALSGLSLRRAKRR